MRELLIVTGVFVMDPATQYSPWLNVTVLKDSAGFVPEKATLYMVTCCVTLTFVSDSVDEGMFMLNDPVPNCSVLTVAVLIVMALEVNVR